MTDKEIRHLSKTELLTIIRDQERELQQMKKQTAELELRLEDKKTHLEQCGSIAEASLQLHKVFEAAQAAADQYLAEVREKQSTADAEAEKILADAKQKAEAQIRSSMDTGHRIEEESRQKADACWDELQEKLKAFCQSHQDVQELLTSCGMAAAGQSRGTEQKNDKGNTPAAKP